jgi:hypothetical protein
LDASQKLSSRAREQARASVATPTRSKTMDNQHRKIAGYRELTQQEIDAINRIKEKAEETGRLIEALADLPNVDKRALAIAKTELQTGFMWGERAVAQPETF